MPSLLDPLPDDAQRVVQVIADAYAETGEWPVWQYVSLTLDMEGIDADMTLWRLPTWLHNYRPVSVIMGTSAGNIPRELSDRPMLTVHGLFHAHRDVAENLIAGFLTAIQVAYDQQRAVRRSPLEVQVVTIGAVKLVTEVATRAGVEIGARQLGLMLSHEPATWIGSPSNDAEDWQWDLSRRSLRAYAAARTSEEYLAVLEELVGVPVVQPSLALPADALPRAIDHLDVAWFAATRKRLFQWRSAARISSLALPANSREEFESRCSALADLLGNVSLDGDRKDGALNLLKRHLEDMLSPDNARRAVDAVDRLRAVVAVRRGQQHSGASADEAKAAASLGLRLADPPQLKWDRLRNVAVEALVAVTEEVETLLPL